MTIERIRELRVEIENERISYGEIFEIQCAADDAGIELTDEMLNDDILDALEQHGK